MTNAKMLGKSHFFAGPGGKHCACCYPAPKHHKAMNRARKRRDRQVFKRNVPAYALGE